MCCCSGVVLLTCTTAAFSFEFSRFIGKCRAEDLDSRLLEEVSYLDQVAEKSRGTDSRRRQEVSFERVWSSENVVSELSVVQIYQSWTLKVSRNQGDTNRSEADRSL